MNKEERSLQKYLWYLSGLILFALVCVAWAQMGDQLLGAQRIILFAIGALIGGFAFLALGEWIRPVTQAPSASVTQAPTASVTQAPSASVSQATTASVAHAQSQNAGGLSVTNLVGGLTNNRGVITQHQQGGTNVVIDQPPPRSIDEEFRQFIRTHLTDKSKEIAPMILTADGQLERINFASQIEDFLKSEGYNVRPRVYFIAAGGTPMGVVIETETDPKAILIKVGINDRK